MTKANALIWIIAGVYLEYQAFDLFGSLSEVTGTEKTVMMIAVIVFVICGAVIAVSGVRRYLAIVKAEKDSAKAEEQKKDQKSISENSENVPEEITEEKQE